MGLFLVSCTKKADYLSKPVQEQILGKWKLEYAVVPPDKDKTYLERYKNFQNVTYEFKSNGYVTIKGKGIDSAGIYPYQVEHKPYFTMGNDLPDLNLLTCCGNKYSIEIGIESNNDSSGDIDNNYYMQLSNFNKGITLGFSRE